MKDQRDTSNDIINRFRMEIRDYYNRIKDLRMMIEQEKMERGDPISPKLVKITAKHVCGSCGDDIHKGSLALVKHERDLFVNPIKYETTYLHEACIDAKTWEVVRKKGRIYDRTN